MAFSIKWEHNCPGKKFYYRNILVYKEYPLLLMTRNKEMIVDSSKELIFKSGTKELLSAKDQARGAS